MNTRYSLIRRGIRGDRFYCVDKTTGKRASLHTTSEDKAHQLLEAKNNSERQPVLNLKLPKPIWPAVTRASPPALGNRPSKP